MFPHRFNQCFQLRKSSDISHCIFLITRENHFSL
ncbi:hypothetical protein [Salmonella phage SD-2_S15]|nr:hypothetical protein [Salmonella phage SD-2_S15]